MQQQKEFLRQIILRRSGDTSPESVKNDRNAVRPFSLDMLMNESKEAYESNLCVSTLASAVEVNACWCSSLTEQRGVPIREEQSELICCNLYL
jgi:hypothetical protein